MSKTIHVEIEHDRPLVTLTLPRQILTIRFQTPASEITIEIDQWGAFISRGIGLDVTGEATP